MEAELKHVKIRLDYWLAKFQEQNEGVEPTIDDIKRYPRTKELFKRYTALQAMMEQKEAQAISSPKRKTGGTTLWVAQSPSSRGIVCSTPTKPKILRAVGGTKGAGESREEEDLGVIAESPSLVVKLSKPSRLLSLPRSLSLFKSPTKLGPLSRKRIRARSSPKEGSEDIESVIEGTPSPKNRVGRKRVGDQLLCFTPEKRRLFQEVAVFDEAHHQPIISSPLKKQHLFHSSTLSNESPMSSVLPTCLLLSPSPRSRSRKDHPRSPIVPSTLSVLSPKICLQNMFSRKMLKPNTRLMFSPESKSKLAELHSRQQLGLLPSAEVHDNEETQNMCELSNPNTDSMEPGVDAEEKGPVVKKKGQRKPRAKKPKLRNAVYVSENFVRMNLRRKNWQSKGKKRKFYGSGFNNKAKRS